VDETSKQITITVGGGGVAKKKSSQEVKDVAVGNNLGGVTGSGGMGRAKKETKKKGGTAGGPCQVSLQGNQPNEGTCHVKVRRVNNGGGGEKNSGDPKR